MAHKLPDVWAARDFPILKAATEAIDEGGRPTIDDLGKATRLSPDEVQRGVKALERRGLVVVRETAQGLLGVRQVAGDAYLLTGLHPDGNDALEALASMFRQAAERTTDAEEKTRLRRAASAVGDVIGQVGAGAMAAFIAHQG